MGVLNKSAMKRRPDMPSSRVGNLEPFWGSITPRIIPKVSLEFPQVTEQLGMQRECRAVVPP